MARAITTDCEMSCDEAVLNKKDIQQRMLYGETIISIIKNQSLVSTVFSTGFKGGKKIMEKRMFTIMDTAKKKAGVMVLCIALSATVLTGMASTANAQQPQKPNSQIATSATSDGQQVKTNQQADKQTEQGIKNQYAIYEQYGLTYNENDDRIYYKDQIVRYFIDRYNNGQGILNMWAYDFDGTVDLYAVRNNVGLQGELVGIEAYKQEDFNLRTKEIEAEKNNIPDYNIKTFRFRKNEAPDSLQLWIRQCEDDVFDFCATQQNGRYYIYVRGETEFGFSVTVDGDEASMEISQISRRDGAKGDGYALFSVPLYKGFTVTYNGAYKSFLQD